MESKLSFQVESLDFEKMSLNQRLDSIEKDFSDASERIKSLVAEIEELTRQLEEESQKCNVVIKEKKDIELQVIHFR